MRLWFLLLALPVVVYFAIGLPVYLNQNKLLFVPERGPIDPASVGVQGLTAVTLHTQDGLDLTAWYKAPAAGRPVLVYFHGNGGNIAGRAGRLRLFDQFGWGALFVEYRGYGPNPGTPSEAGFARDALAGYAFLQERQISGSRIILYGESLGTGVAVRLATERPVGAVILDSPYTSIAAVAQAHFPWLPAALLIRNKFYLKSRIRDIHAPLLIMQGALDKVVPPAQGQADFAEALPPKQFWLGPGTEHWNVLETGGAAVAEQFAAAYVPGA